MSSAETTFTVSPTINAKDLEHLKNLSRYWWHDTLRIKMHHALNEHIVPFIINRLFFIGRIPDELICTTTPLKNIKILEVGCGGGIPLEALAENGSILTGIGINPNLIEVSKQYTSRDSNLKSLKYLEESLKDHALGNPEKYDVVVISHIVEHLNEQELFLENCVKCLKPGGSIFITTISKTIDSWLGGIICAEYIFNVIPRGTHEWRKFISPKKVQKLLESYKCKTECVRGHNYHFPSNSWFWIPPTSMLYVLHAVKDL